MRRSLPKICMLIALLSVLSLSAFAGGQGDEPTGPVTVTYWTSYPLLQATVENAGNKYMAQHPDVTVESILFPQRAMDEKVAVSLPAGEAADLIDFACFQIYPYYFNGYISEPPDDVVGVLEKSFPSFTLTSATDPVSGKKFTIPYYVSLKEMFYNTDHFAEAGLKGTPKTLDEQMEFAKKLTKRDGSGNITRAGLDLRLSGGGFGTFQKYWTQVMVAYDAWPIVQKDGKWTQGYANKAGYDSLQYYMDAIYKHKVEGLDTTSDAQGFGLGASSMFQRESWVVGYLKQNAPDINYSVFLMPAGPDGHGGTIGNTQSFSVPKSSKVKRAAWDFGKYLLSPEIQVQIYEESGWQSLNMDADYSALYKDSPSLEIFMDALSVQGHPVYDYENIPPIMEIHARIADRLMIAFKDAKLATDRKALEALVDKLAEETNRILDDYDLLAK